MKHHLAVKGTLDAEKVRRWLARPLARLRRKLTRFPADAVQLRTVVREVESKPRAEAALTLRLPSTTLAATEDAPDARSALRAAFREIERQLDREKARLRRADDRRRSSEAFRADLLVRAARAAGAAGVEPGADALEVLRGHLDAAARFVRRELAWHEANGEVVAGEVDLRDVVDAAYEAASVEGGRLPAREALLREAGAALRGEVARARAAREEVHFEEEVPADEPSATGPTRGGELYDFYQPDEDLHVEDLIAGVAQTPEELEATAELAAGLREALGALPASWRQAFQLAEIEGLEADDVAHALGVPPDAVPPLLARARSFLRDRLADSGLLDSRDAP